MVFLKNLILRRRGLGCVKNEPDSRDRVYNSGSMTIPTEASLEKYVRGVLDQGATSSCVANAVAAAVSIQEVKSGFKYATPSRLFLYWNSRRLASTVLKDEGTKIRLCCKGLVKYGVPDEKFWPFSRMKINKKPAPSTPWVKAFARKNGEYIAITSGGDYRCADIRAAITQGYPVVFGTELRKSFQAATGPEHIEKPDSSADKKVGRHAMCIVGYKPGYFRVLNSWGTHWRDGGYCWMSEDYIKWGESADFTIIRGWSRISGGLK